FELYKTFPEWQTRKNMTVDEFKGIYFWEYSHRMLGRVIGLTFAGPLAYFLLRKRMPKEMYGRMAFLFGLGGFQGLVGWWMVRSGLEDVDTANRKEIRVSPYRLATHLALAFTTCGLLTWTGLSILKPALPERLNLELFVAEERSRNARLQAVLRLPRGARVLKRVVEYCRHLVWRSRFLDVVWHLKVHRFRRVAWPVLAPRLRARVQHRRFTAVLDQLRSTVRHRSLCREIHARVCRIDAAKTTMGRVLHEMRIVVSDCTEGPWVPAAVKTETVDDTTKTSVDCVMAAMA
ncbi:hypothetical protein SPRG_21840, partial [Saprolegnia parasitica CBS 223.65]